MLPLYLFALIVGGGLLLFSVLAGSGDHGEGVDGSADFEHGDLHAALGDGGWLEVQDFLSLRTVLYLLAGGHPELTEAAKSG